MDRPLYPSELRNKIAEEMWNVSRSDNDPIDPPPVVYAMAEIAMREVHINVDKMLLETIKHRLEGLL